MKFPAHDIYALVADHGKAGSIIMETDLTGKDVLRTIADVLECLDDNTSGVLRISEGRIDDVSEDVARAWMKSAGLHHEWNLKPVPPLVEAHCADDVEHECTMAVYRAEDDAKFRRQERAYHQSVVL